MIAVLEFVSPEPEALAEQNAGLYEVSGSDPAAGPDVVRRALERAGVLDAHRPVQDLRMLTASLRDVVQRMNTDQGDDKPQLP